MREIKFRAWDTLRKEMNNWEDILSSDTGIHFVLEGTSNNRWIPMQFTGLKDNKRTKKYPNGQEIYEGDILQTTVGTYGIIFKNGSWQGKPIKKSPECYGTLTTSRVYSGVKRKEFVVIGNIHENPELIGGNGGTP